MRPKQPLRLRWWVVASNLAGQQTTEYFSTEPEARVRVIELRQQIPATLELYPDDAVERYFGVSADKEYGIEVRRLNAHDVLQRYPRTVAHLICHSLGYCTPLFAGSLVLSAAKNAASHCEWIASCYRSDPWPALWAAIEQRHQHHGFMADMERARDLVEHVRDGGTEPLFASWF